MTEHVHVWEGIPHFMGALFRCECGEVLGHGVIERRLNATERLSAEDATKAASDVLGFDYHAGPVGEEQLPHLRALRAYAATLKEKTP